MMLQAMLVGLQILTAGSALADVIGPKWAALGALVVAAAQGSLHALEVLAQRGEQQEAGTAGTV